ncbi:MAG: polysaccharide biosynthesis tyrosine autokinase [Saprospiraceae bacterium]|nr:polysaccharide biosynthesis tyrosine autokinase [Saprospiraceae bacterium]MCF8283234.1 polysaccharide biosynthesis tyrosine autokinase [Bacteroidales bacterium]MCF8314360.1 polysaccharide biosynthesis tyrosine autokinase [Saprospiraceae bacterium]MCF8443228.1 polysaccharide biosynthesis tyrosine autokinase [Saprospiraceae bacterium]
MNFKKEYQQIIRPLFKASPVIIGLIVIAVVVMHRAVSYMTPEYRALGMIKINNLSYSQAAFNLFGKEEGALPKQNENFLTEVEVFKSRDLIKKALKNLNWELTIFRVGKLRHVEIYEESPFTIDYQAVTEAGIDKTQFFDFLGDNKFRIRTGGEKDSTGITVALGDSVRMPGITFSIHFREEFLKEKPNSLLPGDRFAFTVNSLESLANMCAGEKLFVNPVEKDISIIKIFFNHELPEKAQAFVNELMKTYIEEGRMSKVEQADETLTYLDRQLEDVGSKLQSAEVGLSKYRSSNQLLSTDLETDATLRELTQLDLRKVDLEMKYGELERLHNYLISGNKLSDFSPNYEALQDPIFRESYLKAQAYESERKDLLQKYTAQNPAVTNLDEKMRETRSFLNESVTSTISNLAVRRGEVDANIDDVSSRIKRYPEKERQLIVFEREVSLNENIYNFLMKKRTELAIGKTSDLSPHKIIEYAERPKGLVAPNKSLLYGLAVLLSLMAGMFYAYLRSFFKEKINAKEELEVLPAPLLGIVYKRDNHQKGSFQLVSGLMAALEKLPSVEKRGQGKLIVATSMVPGEGKSFIATEMAKAYAATGKRVLVVDMDIRKPTLHLNFGLSNNIGFCDILEGRIYALNAIQHTDSEKLFVLNAGQLRSNNYALLFSRRSLDFIYDFRWHFDVVIVDTPPVSVFEDSLPIMNESSVNLFVLRAGFTKQRMLGATADLMKQTDIPNLHLVLNGVKTSSKVPGYVKYLKKYYGEDAVATA